MAGRKSIKIEELIQHVREWLLEDMDFDPSQVRRFFVSNIFTRTFAHLVAWTGTRAKRLLCTGAGILKVAPLGTGFEHNDTKADNAPDEYGTALKFDQVCSRIDIFIFDNPALVKRSVDGDAWDDEFEIPSGGFYSIDCTTHSINIKNKTALSVARYSINGWW